MSGLWHGASWNFVIWGAFHGFFLILDRLFLKKVLDKIGTIPSVIFTFFVVVVGWVFFSIEELDKALMYLGRMFSFENLDSIYLSNEVVAISIIAIVISFACLTKPGKYLQNVIYDEQNVRLSRQFAYVIIAGIIFMLSVSSITGDGFNPFIYTRF